MQLQTANASFKSAYKTAFGPEDGQAQVYDSVKPVVSDAFLGFNGAVIAYGQTGTGKTHTMMGPHPLKSAAGAPELLCCSAFLCVACSAV